MLPISLSYDALTGYAYLAALLGDGQGETVELRALKDGEPTQRLWIYEPGEEVETVNRWISEGRNVYAGVTTRRYGKGKKPDLMRARHLWSEIDFKRFARGEVEARERLSLYPRPPKMIVRSGGGLHAYWQIAPYDLRDEKNRAHIESILLRLIEDCGADTGTQDSTRILRLPGTLNFKYDPPRPVLFEDDAPTANVVYDLADFPAMPERKPGPVAKPAGKPKAASGDNRGLADELLRRALSQARDGRHKAALWLACQLRDNRFSLYDAETILNEFCRCAPAGDHPFTEEEGQKVLADAYKSAPREAWSEPLVGSDFFGTISAAAEEDDDSETEEEDCPRGQHAEETPPVPDTSPDPEPTQAPAQSSSPFLANLNKAFHGLADVRVCGLVISGELTEDEYLKLGKRLARYGERIRDQFCWMLGDWYRSLTLRYGERQETVEKALGKGTYEQVRQCARVSAAWPLSRRHVDKPFWLHQCLSAKGITPDVQDHWMQEYAKGGVTRARLRQELGTTRPRAHAETKEERAAVAVKDSVSLSWLSELLPVGTLPRLRAVAELRGKEWLSDRIQQIIDDAYSAEEIDEHEIENCVPAYNLEDLNAAFPPLENATEIQHETDAATDVPEPSNCVPRTQFQNAPDDPKTEPVTAKETDSTPLHPEYGTQFEQASVQDTQPAQSLSPDPPPIPPDLLPYADLLAALDRNDMPPGKVSLDDGTEVMVLANYVRVMLKKVDSTMKEGALYEIALCQAAWQRWKQQGQGGML